MIDKLNVPVHLIEAIKLLVMFATKYAVYRKVNKLLLASIVVTNVKDLQLYVNLNYGQYLEGYCRCPNSCTTKNIEILLSK